MIPEFSERQFEFCYNAEFVRKHRPALVGMPFIPTQKQEKCLGYDAWFQLRQSKAQYSLFHQYKVSNFASSRRGTNSHVYSIYNAPYYYFYLDKSDWYRQHSLLCLLRNRGYRVYYVVPLFHLRTIFQLHFANDAIINNCFQIDPWQAWQIPNPYPVLWGTPPHKISYKWDGSQMNFHSEDRIIKGFYTFDKLSKELEKTRIDTEYVMALLSTLKSIITGVYKEPPFLSKNVQELKPIYQCIYLLRRYYNLSWIMF